MQLSFVNYFVDFMKENRIYIKSLYFKLTITENREQDVYSSCS